MDLLDVRSEASRHWVRLPDLDVVVRRIFPVQRFLEAIRSVQLALIAPHLWDDPREDAPSLCMLDGRKHVGGKMQQPLSDFLAPVWAQCWSLNPGSDTLLRAYSQVRVDPETKLNMLPDQEGVTVSTTVRHLLALGERWHREGADGHLVVGRVEYLDDQEIWQRIVNGCNGKNGPRMFGTVQGRAESLLWKRKYFEHEAEVRVILIDRTKPPVEVSSVRLFNFDPNETFLTVSVDPRLVSFEAREREQQIRDAGFAGEIKRDDSYQKVLSLLEMHRDWDQPEFTGPQADQS
jgi:hypothetical protein